MPALTGAIDFARSLRKEAEKYQKETEKSNDEIKDEVKKQVREQKVTNTLTSQMTGLLKSISENTLIQTRFMAQQTKFDRQNRIFAEEEAREKDLQNKKLVDALKNLGFGGTKKDKKDSDNGLLSAMMGGLNIKDLLTGALGGAGLIIVATMRKKIAVVLGALADGVKSILAAIAALAAKMGLQSLGGFGRGTSIPGKIPSARTQSRIPKGQPGAGRFTKAPVRGAGLRAGMGLAGAALRTNPFTFALGAGLLLPEVLEMMGYDPYGAMADFFFPPAQGSTNQKSSTSSTNDYLKKVIQVESGGRSNAQASTSSAYGLGQFTKGTFESLAINSSRNSILYGKSFEDYKKSEELQIEALKALTEQNRARLVRSGLPTDDASLYLAHFLGAGMALRVLQSNDNVNLRSVLPSSYFTANPAVFGNLKTVGDLKAWAARKMGGSAPTQGSQAGGRPRPNFGRRSNSNFIVPSANRGVVIGDPSQIYGYGYGDGGSGSAVPKELTVPVKDETVAKKIDVLTDATQKIKSSSAQNVIQTRRLNENLVPTKRQETRNQRLAREANERFLAGFQALTTTKITNALEKALFPKGYGVTAAQASAERYRGDALGDLFKTQRFFNRTFGSEYGPLFDQLSRSYLEIGASNVGNMLFGKTAGVDAQALTGQILGNIRQGKKDVALEQLLYGMTGTSSGYETLFAKYGFGSAQQGVQTMGNIFGAGATDIVRRNAPFMGEVPGQTFYKDPATGRQIPYGGLMQSPFGTVKVGGLNAQAVFVTNDKQAGVSTTASASGAGRSIATGIEGFGAAADSLGGPLLEATVDTNKTLTNQHNEQQSYLEKVHDDDKAWTENSDKIRRESAAAGVGATMAAAASTGNVFTRGIEWLGSIFTSSAGRGGGTNLNIGFGGSGGTFGNFLMDLGKTAVVSKLTSGIKNPYAKAIANFGLNRAADVGIQTIMKGGNIGNVLSNLSTAFNLPNTLNTLSNLPTTLSNFFSGTTSTGIQGFGAAADMVGGSLAAGSGTAISTIGMEAAVAAQPALSYAGAQAGATSAAASSTLGSQLTALASNPVTWIVLAAFLLFGRKKKAPTAVHKAIAIVGNSNIDAKHTVFTRHNPPKAYFDAADQFLNVAFNATKTLEIKTGKRAPFDYIYMRVESDRVEIDYGEGAFKQHLKSTGALEGKRLGGGIHTVQIPVVAKQIVDHIGEKFKTASSEDTEKIERGLEELGRKSIKTLTSGIEASISRDLNKAPSSVESSELSKSIQAESLLTQFQAPTMETISDGESEQSTGERLIYDFRTGKMIKQSETGFGVTRSKEIRSDGEGGSYEVNTVQFDERIIGINKQGKPVYNIGDSAINAEDITGMLDADPSLITSVTPAAGTITLAPPKKDTKDYSAEIYNSKSPVTVVTDNSQTSNVSMTGDDSPPDGRPFVLGTIVGAVS
jgi:hypothetical protein